VFAKLIEVTGLRKDPATAPNANGLFGILSQTKSLSALLENPGLSANFLELQAAAQDAGEEDTWSQNTYAALANVFSEYISDKKIADVYAAAQSVATALEQYRISIGHQPPAAGPYVEAQDKIGLHGQLVSRFQAFYDALNYNADNAIFDFRFDSFKEGFLDNQQELINFANTNNDYVPLLIREKQAESQVASLERRRVGDSLASDIKQPVLRFVERTI
jgi:hypothetical protein